MFITVIKINNNVYYSNQNQMNNLKMNLKFDFQYFNIRPKVSISAV